MFPHLDSFLMEMSVAWWSERCQEAEAVVTETLLGDASFDDLTALTSQHRLDHHDCSFSFCRRSEPPRSRPHFAWTA
ncbi:hypothetical protein [Novipirellula galeiformis]|uniref:hypothetical protein n=1 Tax=Novipirellula galeiformis TaxID=2528004 RepID=UPI0018CE7847|nr:hypothetical protein [Novipirellula galeiformis]